MSHIRQVHPHPRDGLRGYVPGQVGGMGGFWGDAKYTLGQSQANEFANMQVDAAEARGAPRTTVAAWRALLVEYNNAKDLDAIQALALEADGWTAAGNAGVITTRVSDSVDEAKAKVAAVIDEAKKAVEAPVNKIVYFGAGLAILYVVISARRGLI